MSLLVDTDFYGTENLLNNMEDQNENYFEKKYWTSQDRGTLPFI